MSEVKGFVKNKFNKVYKNFEDNLNKRSELGASLCVYHQNKIVVDIWGGYKSSQKNDNWSRDTLVPVFSTSKAVGAACLALLHSRGCFNYSDRVSDYWPEFAQNGKDNITIKELLQHRAGLSAIDHKLTPEIIRDYKKLDKLLAEQKPKWKPGEYQGYHVWTIGWYMSALISRIDPEGKRLGEFIKKEINPHSKGDFYIGLDNNFDMSKIATLVPFSKIKGLLAMPYKFVKEFFKPWSLTFKSMLNPSFAGNHKNFNKKEILKLEIGSGNGVGNAIGLATIMNDLFIDESSALKINKNTISKIMEYPEPPPNGFEDIVFKQDAFRFHCGFMKPSSKHDFSNNKRAFGGFGAGGSFVIIDPQHEIVMAYTMNKMSSKTMNDDREVALRKAVYSSI